MGLYGELVDTWVYYNRFSQYLRMFYNVLHYSTESDDMEGMYGSHVLHHVTKSMKENRKIMTTMVVARVSMKLTCCNQGMPRINESCPVFAM